MEGPTSCLWRWLLAEGPKVTGVGEGEEKSDPPHALSGDGRDRQPSWKTVWRFLSKVHESAHPSEKALREIKSPDGKDVCTHIPNSIIDRSHGMKHHRVSVSDQLPRETMQESGMVMHAFNSSTWEAEAGGSLRAWGQPGYTVRPCLKKEKKGAGGRL